MRSHHRPKTFPICFLAILLLCGSLFGCEKPESGPLYSPQERVGFGVSQRRATIEDYDVSQLGAGWYSNWAFDADPPRPAGLEYVQLIPVTRSKSPDLDQLRVAIEAQPGSLWIIGNEPERRALDLASAAHDFADLDPAAYASVYRDLYTFIKQADPTAQVAIGGVVQPTEVRLMWLDRVLEAYEALTGVTMPVDVWNIHIQIMREKRAYAGCPDCWGADIPQGIDDVSEGRLFEIEDNVDVEILKSLVWDFRRWMKAKGEQDKPLIISEYGVLMPSEYLGETKEAGDARVEHFMLESFSFFQETRDTELGYPVDEHRLVQRWLWYSLNEVPYHYEPAYDTWIGFNGALFDWELTEYPGEMTPLGEAFAAYTNSFSASEGQ